MRDPAHAGKLRERVCFLEGGLDANDDREGPELVELFDCRAQVEAEPGPAHVQAERIEAAAVICLTVRSTRRTRALQPGVFTRWLRYPARLYRLREPVEDPRRMWVTVYADAYAAGAGG